MVEYVVAHVALDISGSAENAVSPSEPARDHHDGDDRHLSDREFKIAGRHCIVCDLVDDVPDDERDLGLSEVYDEEYRHADQIVPLIFPDEVTGVRTFDNIKNTGFFVLPTGV